MLTWLKHAPLDVIARAAPIEQYAQEKMDAYLVIIAPENTREGSDVPAERLQALRVSRKTAIERVLAWKMPWVGCNFPTPALAQDANMSLERYTDMLYEACLLDWDAVARQMRHLADRFDAADEVHLIGEGTDLRIGLRGRQAMIDDGHVNMPGGEFFYSPVEDSAEGVITYAEYPAIFQGHSASGVRLEFERGRVVRASADTGQDFLLATLDSDEGARYLGELGVGCNPGIQTHMRDTLFDEKINGTIHLALGAGFPLIGGKNVSNVHWDMVKNLRNGGKILLDGAVVQEDGRWLI
jgi:aminopeptidase